MLVFLIVCLDTLGLQLRFSKLLWTLLLSYACVAQCLYVHLCLRLCFSDMFVWTLVLTPASLSVFMDSWITLAFFSVSAYGLLC